MRELGVLELEVMQQVWAIQPATAREVQQRFKGDKARAYTTIMTTMDRLFHKGLLRRQRHGTAWCYEAEVDRAGYERAVADALASAIVEQGDIGLAAFVDAAADDAVLDRLSALIAARRRADRR